MLPKRSQALHALFDGFVGFATKAPPAHAAASRAGQHNLAEFAQN